MRACLPLRPLVLGLFALSVPAAQEETPKVSELGRYEGYSEELFDGWKTTSRYIKMRDKVQLAVDVTRPTFYGELVEDPLPVVWTHSRYHRRMMGNGMVDAQPDLQRLVKHGYVVASVGVRGSGASFGRFEGLFSESETKDAFEITEWLASQPWCDGNIGMFGGSYLGITQYMNASLAPPALKAIFPNVAAFDMYDLLYPGGVFRSDMMQHWDGLTRMLDLQFDPAPVDADPDGILMAKAREEHEDNWDVMKEYSAGRFRDHATPSLTYAKHGPSAYLKEINEAKVPAYHFNGWFDVFAADATLWFVNYEGPQRLLMGAWSHAGMPDRALMAERSRLLAVEQHRWFDRWLKGIENGVDEQPPVQYALMVDPGQWEWQASKTWPVENAVPTRYYFGEGKSGSVSSNNDGTLSSGEADLRVAFDAYQMDAETTTGRASRWDNAVGAAPMMRYDRLAKNDEKCLTYTTAPLEKDLVVTGHPVARLFLTSSTGDADLHLVLEEVDETGAVTYVTEGVLRASQRKLAKAPWDNMGLPYQRCFEGDQEPLPDEPTEVVFDLHPTAAVFNAGHRIRVALMLADADNTETSAGRPLIRLYRGGDAASSIELPVVP